MLYLYFQVVPKWRLVDDCCEGYERSLNGTHCVPTCTQECHHGVCVAPDKCECDSGFGGNDCLKCKFRRQQCIISFANSYLERWYFCGPLLYALTAQCVYGNLRLIEKLSV